MSGEVSSPCGLIRTVRQLAREASQRLVQSDAAATDEQSFDLYSAAADLQDELVALLTDAAHQPVLDRIERMLTVSGAVQ